MITDLLVDLAACLCAEIEAAGPSTCFCGVIPGDAAIGDYAGNCSDKNGMAWVRLVNAYPADQIGQPNTNPGNCSSGLGMDIEVGILRKAPLPDSRGNPPPPSALAAAFDQQMTDMLTMRKAVACCDALNSKDYILSIYNPLGPAGDLGGGAWTLSVVV